MFVTRKSYDAVVRERDEALALVAKLRRGCETRAAIDAAIISGRDSTIKELEEEVRQALKSKDEMKAYLNACANSAIHDRDQTIRALRTQISRAHELSEETVGKLLAQLRRAYVRDARGRIARHPLNTGGKVKA